MAGPLFFLIPWRDVNRPPSVSSHFPSQGPSSSSTKARFLAKNTEMRDPNFFDPREVDFSPRRGY